MSAKPETVEVAKAPAKNKKVLLIVVGAVLVLVLGGGGAFFYVSKQRAAAQEGEDGESVKSAHAAPKTPPVYLPLDTMVVNLADPGGEKVVQVGITLEVSDSHASDKVKAYLPTIRSGVLMLISQRTSEELLKQEGKEKLAKDILRLASVPFGGSASGRDEKSGSTNKKNPEKKEATVEYPVVGVLFSSFIVQ